MPEYPGKPTTIDERAWFYTEPLGLRVVAEAKNRDGSHAATTVTLIPWRKVRLAIATHSKVTKRR